MLGSVTVPTPFDQAIHCEPDHAEIVVTGDLRRIRQAARCDRIRAAVTEQLEVSLVDRPVSVEIRRQHRSSPGTVVGPIPLACPWDEGAAPRRMPGVVWPTLVIHAGHEQILVDGIDDAIVVEIRVVAAPVGDRQRRQRPGNDRDLIQTEPNRDSFRTARAEAEKVTAAVTNDIAEVRTAALPDPAGGGRLVVTPAGVERHLDIGPFLWKLPGSADLKAPAGVVGGGGAANLVRPAEIPHQCLDRIPDQKGVTVRRCQVTQEGLRRLQAGRLECPVGSASR